MPTLDAAEVTFGTTKVVPYGPSQNNETRQNLLEFVDGESRRVQCSTQGR